MSEPIHYAGLRELAQAFAVIDREMLGNLVRWLEPVGGVVEREARRKFIQYGSDKGNPASFVKSAESFETRVRAGGQALALVLVGQHRRSSRDVLRRRPNWGGLQMKHGLLPARAAKISEAAEILEVSVWRNLKARGF